MDSKGAYVSDLRRALAHLHDLAYLESHPLARRIAFIAQAPTLSRGQLLRRTLRLSIEALDPGPEVPANSPEARPYQILRARYISQQGITDIAQQLGIGERQAYRELRRGIEALAQILRESEVPDEPRGALSANSLPCVSARVRAEVERVSGANSQSIDLSRLVSEVVESAQRLANDHGTQIDYTPETQGLYVTANRVVLRQAILNLLSHIVRFHPTRAPRIRVWRSGEEARVQVVYRSLPQSEPPRPGQPYAVAVELLDSLGIDWQREETGGDEVRIVLGIPLVQQHKVLIIDDNMGLIRLFERYLQGQGYLVQGATSVDQAEEMLDRIHPDVVILDVMMPGRDGWEVLQSLRRIEAGASARVLVCSIINDPQLAKALGANGFLHKPVDRASLLQALDRLISRET